MSVKISVKMPILAALCLCAVAAAASDTESIPKSVMEFWEYQWEEEVDYLIADLSTEFGDKFLNEDQPERRAAFIADMERAIAKEITWESHGAEQYRRLLPEHCGDSLLQKVAAFHGEGNLGEKMPDALLSEYADCTSDVLLDANLEIITTIVEIAKEVYPPLFEKYGIQDD